MCQFNLIYTTEKTKTSLLLIFVYVFITVLEWYRRALTRLSFFKNLIKKIFCRACHKIVLNRISLYTNIYHKGRCSFSILSICSWTVFPFLALRHVSLGVQSYEVYGWVINCSAHFYTRCQQKCPLHFNIFSQIRFFLVCFFFFLKFLSEPSYFNFNAYNFWLPSLIRGIF